LSAATVTGSLSNARRTEREDLIKRLTLYRLRAKVTIAPDDTPVFAGGGQGLVDTRHADMPARHYGDGDASGSLEAYDSQRAALGVLEGPQEIIASQDFPHDVALDLTGAVSFTKGCFVGQEVVSRVKHRGTARRRPVFLSGAPLQPGAPVMAGEREIGSVRLVAGGQGVAVLRIDQISQPATVDGTPVTLALPPYATYSLEASQETETS
jgi:folate-binding protein YgfZ